MNFPEESQLYVNNDLLEIVFHGRGAQGAWTASELLAKAALGQGKYIQSFPQFGPERMGAPVKAFCRINNKPIRIHCGIYYPKVVIILDPTLIKAIKNRDGKDIWDGLLENGILVVNTKEPPEKLPELIQREYGYDDIPDLSKYIVSTVPAIDIATKILGRPITNTAMLGGTLGAFSKYRRIPQKKLPCPKKPRVKLSRIPLESMYSVVEERFPPKIAERNIEEKN